MGLVSVSVCSMCIRISVHVCIHVFAGQMSNIGNLVSLSLIFLRRGFSL